MEVPSDEGSAPGASGEATVLVVDDDQDLADTCAIWLRDAYDVRIAYNGSEALDRLDPEVDVVLLDRRMPDMAGDDVLDEIRAENYDCRVSMMTAVEPNEDIVDMPFDEYLVKPVTRKEVLDTVSELEARNEFDEDVQEYFAVTAKLAALETQLSDAELADSPEYEALEERANELRTVTEDRLDDVDFEAAFREVDSP